MPQKYLSTDPNAGSAPGKYLSTDPNAGTDAGPSRINSIKQGAKEGGASLIEQAKGTLRLMGATLLPGSDPGLFAESGESLLAAAKNPRAAVGSMKPDMSDPWRGGTRFTIDTLLPLLLPGAPKGLKAIRGMRSGKLTLETAQELGARMAKEQPFTPPANPTVSTSRIPFRAPDPTTPSVAGRLTTANAPTTIEGALAEVLEDLRKVEPPKTVTLPPPAAQPAVSYPKIAQPRAQGATGGGRPRKAAAPPKSETPATPEPTPAPSELPASWQALVDKAAPTVPTRAGAPATIAGLPSEPPMWQAARPSLGEARRAVGSRRVTEQFPEIEAIAKELGISPETMVRDLTGGARRTPMTVAAADDSLNYMRRIADERGAIDPKLAAQIGLPVAGAAVGGAAADDNPLAGALLGALAGMGAANPSKTAKGLQTLRVTGMLSGAALPKSMAGNAGSFLTASMERGSLAPIKEALRLPTNTRAAIKGFREGANPSGTGGMGAVNIPGRLMGAMDEASTQALQRAGLSLDEAQRLLLTRPNPLGSGRLSEQLQTPLGRAVMPFQRTPFNAGIEGMKSLNDLLPGSGASGTNRALTAGAIAGGAAAGSETDDPLLLAILAAAAGPRGIPMALGAATTAGPKVLERMGAGFPEGSWKDLLNPIRPIDQPALLRLLEQLSGEAR